MTTTFKTGDRVELVTCNDKWSDLAPGTRGLVLRDFPATEDYDCQQLQIRWDSGSWLMLVPDSGDEAKVVDNDAFCPHCGEPGTPVDWTAHNACGWWVCTGDDHHEFEHRVRQIKVPEYVECLSPEDDARHRVEFFQGVAFCPEGSCRAVHKIA